MCVFFLLNNYLVTGVLPDVSGCCLLTQLDVNNRTVSVRLECYTPYDPDLSSQKRQRSVGMVLLIFIRRRSFLFFLLHPVPFLLTKDCNVQWEVGRVVKKKLVPPRSQILAISLAIFKNAHLAPDAHRIQPNVP